jgi:hypothetical protein
VLGKGAFATVYLGQLAGQDVAVKVFSPRPPPPPPPPSPLSLPRDALLPPPLSHRHYHSRLITSRLTHSSITLSQTPSRSTYIEIPSKGMRRSQRRSRRF